MTPVILLTDGYIATSSEPWRLPDVDALPDISVPYASVEPGRSSCRICGIPRHLSDHGRSPGSQGWNTGSAAWRRTRLTGNVSYDPDNHETMTEVRTRKIAAIATTSPSSRVHGGGSDLLVLGWGSTYGAIRTASTGRASPAGRSPTPTFDI